MSGQSESADIDPYATPAKVLGAAVHRDGARGGGWGRHLADLSDVLAAYPEAVRVVLRSVEEEDAKGKNMSALWLFCSRL